MPLSHLQISTKPNAFDVIVARFYRWLKSRLRLSNKFTLLSYTGFGDDDKVKLIGRVVESIKRPSPNLNSFRITNFLYLLKIFGRARAEKVGIKIDIDGKSHKVVTDGLGFFELNLPRESGYSNEWNWAHLPKDTADRCLEPSSGESRVFDFSTEGTPVVSIISDIDDTVLESNATDVWKSAKLTFLNNAETRKAVEGMSGLYSSILEQNQSAKDKNQMFYVTSSSWSLFPVLSQFLQINEFPVGPILMQSVGVTNNKLKSRGHSHKLDKIKVILEMSGNTKFVLVGDSGQHDRKIFLEIARWHPERIEAILVRKVDEVPTNYAKLFKTLGTKYCEFTEIAEAQRFIDLINSDDAR